MYSKEVSFLSETFSEYLPDVDTIGSGYVFTLMQA